VGKKQHVELGAFRRLRELDVMLEVDAGIGLGIRVTPGRHMVAGRIEKGPEPHLAFACRHGPILTCTAARRGLPLARGGGSYAAQMPGTTKPRKTALGRIMNFKRIGRAVVTAGMAFVAAATAAAAQSYPDRPVKLIVPFAPGGPMDTMARF